MGHPHLRPDSAVCRHTVAQEKYSFRDITVSGPYPPTMDGSERTPGGDILLGRYRYQLVNPLIQGRVVSDEREQNDAAAQGHGQSHRMSQSASLGDCWFALCQCLVWKAETEEVDPQDRLRVYVGVGRGVMDKRAVGDRIIESNRRFQMGPG